MNGTLTDVTGIQVGHVTDSVSGTGCTAIIAIGGATAGVDVRGSAPGTRETDLLRAHNTVTQIHGICLSGGSAFGLASASGVMRFLEEQGVGHRVGDFLVPIVPGAIIFDLGVGNGSVRPGDADGYQAAQKADNSSVEIGSVGAGTGATVGKALGRDKAMKGGIGCASLDLGGGLVLAALSVVNSVGSVHDPSDGSLLAGPLGPNGQPLSAIDIYGSSRYGTQTFGSDALGNTTIGVVATNARFQKPQAERIAALAHDGIALAVRPAHTLHDGDTYFTMATGQIDAPDEFPRIVALTPSVVADSIANAVRNATGIHGYHSMKELHEHEQ